MLRTSRCCRAGAPTRRSSQLACGPRRQRRDRLLATCRAEQRPSQAVADCRGGRAASGRKCAFATWSARAQAAVLVLERFVGMGASISTYDGSLREPASAGFASSSSARASSLRSELSQSAAGAVRTSAPPAECPIDHSSMRKQRLGKDSPLNPLNRMPELTQLRSEGQQTDLPTQRTVSSIPRRRASDGSESACPVAHAPSNAAADAEPSNWVYPSPQQVRGLPSALL